MSTKPFVQCSDNGDGSADFTISFAEDDHRFSATAEGNEALVEYEETLSWRGKIRTSEPDESVYRELMQSQEMANFLDRNGLDSVRREKR